MCAIGAALECDKGTVPLSHSRKACLAQGFVEDDGGAVGEVECADAVVVRIDEVAADVLPKDGFVAVLGMPERFLVGFPGLSPADERLHLLTKKARRTYAQSTYRDGDYLVFGSESSGIPEPLLAAAPERCERIPMLRDCDSLDNARLRHRGHD